MRTTILLFALLIVCCGAALAQTPDLLTPAEETVCDMETGAAYGLCNAYCEAMDCETDDPQASATACSKVGDKFTQLTGRELPCEVACPCYDLPPFIFPFFRDIVDGNVAIDACFTEQPGLGGTEGIFVFIGENPQGRPEGISGLFPDVGPGGWFCGLATGGGIFSITPEQGAACAALLQQAAATQGVSCVAP